jgi:NADP-dependent 3-hydroxy acid dehydrogenase YdfG
MHVRLPTPAGVRVAPLKQSCPCPGCPAPCLMPAVSASGHTFFFTGCAVGASLAGACAAFWNCCGGSSLLQQRRRQAQQQQASLLPPRGSTTAGLPVDTAGVLVEGRVAVITGAGSGIGRETAVQLARIGMRLVLADIDDADLASAAAEVAAVAKNGAADVIAQRTDVSDLEQVQALKEAAFERFGEVGLLMNNAAIQNNGVASPVEHLERWRDIMDVNLWGVVNGCQVFGEAMIAQDTPCVIVNTGSKQGITMPPGDTAYNSSKAAVKTLTEGLQHRKCDSQPPVSIDRHVRPRLLPHLPHQYHHTGAEFATDLRSLPGCKVNAFLLVPGWTITMIATRANRRLQGAAFDPTKAQDERAYDGVKDPEYARQKLEARGAWTASAVVDVLLAAVKRGAPFYIICPDNETTPGMDLGRIQWACDDLIFGRVPLSRWSEQYKEEYKQVCKLFV